MFVVSLNLMSHGFVQESVVSSKNTDVAVIFKLLDEFLDTII